MCLLVASSYSLNHVDVTIKHEVGQVLMATLRLLYEESYVSFHENNFLKPIQEKEETILVYSNNQIIF